MRDEVTSVLFNVKDWIADELISGYTLDLQNEENKVIEDIACDVQSVFSDYQCELENIDIEEIKDALRDDARGIADIEDDDEIEAYMEARLKREVEGRIAEILD